MRAQRTQRVRDPVHGLIVFESEGDHAPRDQLAWALLDTAPMQRLRRVRQLGVSEFTFPGATHSRFAHSLGVFHVARRLARNLKRLLRPGDWRSDRADVAVFAALLHDVGHGPFSHAFERVQEGRGTGKDHEDWTAEIILADGPIRSLLDDYRPGMAEHVAKLLGAKTPGSAYDAIVSSSFDADRLDYLRRDRMMTGSGAGAIDFDWLLDNLVLGEVPMGSDDDETVASVQTFCLRRKALQAAEAFLLARYQLFEQVYLHKATRGMEALVEQVIRRVADAAATGEVASIGLDGGDALVRFFGPGGGALPDYLALDDAAVWAAAGRMARGPDQEAALLAKRLLNRERLPCIDLGSFPSNEYEGESEAQRAREGEERRRRQEKIDALDAAIKADPDVKGSFPPDRVSYNAYGQIGADDTRLHKRLAILVDGGVAQEITALSGLVRALRPAEIVRYYFPNDKLRQRIREKVGL